MSTSHQINFFMNSDDLRTFATYLHSSCDTSIIAVPMQNKIVEDGHSIYPVEEGEWLARYLTLKQFLSNVQIEYVAAQNYYVVDELTSSVVEFSRCYQEDRMLRRGRLYFICEYFDTEGNVVRKPEVFVRFGQKLIGWIKSSYVKDPHTRCYVGPHTLEWQRTSGAQLVV